MDAAPKRLTVLAVRDEDRERAQLAIERIITMAARNSGGGWACLPYDEIRPLAREIIDLFAKMKIGCLIDGERAR